MLFAIVDFKIFKILIKNYTINPIHIALIVNILQRFRWSNRTAIDYQLLNEPSCTNRFLLTTPKELKYVLALLFWITVIHKLKKTEEILKIFFLFDCKGQKLELNKTYFNCINSIPGIIRKQIVKFTKEVN